MNQSRPSLAVATVAFLVAACTNNANSGKSVGAGGASGANTDGGESSGGELRPFSPPSDPGNGGVLFAVSGEVLALNGYAFPPAEPDDAAFVDGWDVHFSRLLVTLDHFRLSENPDSVPGDQSKTGKVVAEVDGPWAVDLAHGDPTYLSGKGGPGEEAVPIFGLSKQNQNGGDSFATDGTRYAFGFDAVPAVRSAYNVNLDGGAASDYQKMTADGCTVLYVGTASFKGDKSNPGCYPQDRRDFPDVVNFWLCFKAPTTYANCQNPDNAGDPFPSEEYERGIAFLTNSSVVAQATIHTDHPFWDSVLHDSPAHFDQFAARAVGEDAGVPTVTLEMTEGVDYTAYTDALGHALDWRYCIDPPTDVHPRFDGPMRFDPESVPHAVGTNERSGLRDYYDFTTYDQSTQGHLNSDGLCFVKRNYPSPE